jgi:hypothetical protein
MIQVGDNFSPNALSTSQSRIYMSHPATSLPRYLYWSIRVIIENLEDSDYIGITLVIRCYLYMR